LLRASSRTRSRTASAISRRTDLGRRASEAGCWAGGVVAASTLLATADTAPSTAEVATVTAVCPTRLIVVPSVLAVVFRGALLPGVSRLSGPSAETRGAASRAEGAEVDTALPAVGGEAAGCDGPAPRLRAADVALDDEEGAGDFDVGGVAAGRGEMEGGLPTIETGSSMAASYVRFAGTRGG
jgi:hypothetical protein